MLFSSSSPICGIYGHDRRVSGFLKTCPKRFLDAIERARKLCGTHHAGTLDYGVFPILLCHKAINQALSAYHDVS